MHLFYSAPWPSPGIIVRRKVSTAAELEGLRLKNHTLETARFARLAGMVPTTIEVPYFSDHFESGYSDAALVSPMAVSKRELWQYVSHFLRIGMWSNRNAMLIDLATLRSLGEKERAALTSCGIEAAERGHRLSVETETVALVRMASEGMTITDSSDALRDHLSRVVGAPFLQDWLDEIGEEGAAIIDAYRRDETD